MNYKNQHEIHFNKNEIINMYNKNEEQFFLHSLSWEKLLKVTSELNGNEFKVWLYFMKWSGNSFFYYSPATLEKEFNISESTAQRCFKRLIELKYLEQIDNKSYQFHPLKKM